MSFLNSILSSIEGKPLSPPYKAKKSPNEDSSNAVETSPLSKTGRFSGLSCDSFRNEQTAHSSGFRHDSEKNEGLSSQIPTASAASKVPKRIGNLKKVTAVLTSSQTTHTFPSLPARHVLPASRESNSVPVAPKKGTYQEILARAKAAQKAQPGSGIIKHKPIEKLPRREKLKQNTKSSYKSHESKDTLSDSVNNTCSNKESLHSGKSAEVSAKKRKRVDLGYKGTMRPSNGMVTQFNSSEFGTNATEGPSWTRACLSRPHARSKYRTTSEPNAEENSEEYHSDASSDMEAAALDLEEEEQQSLSAAKKEDEAAAAEELELKRNKVERRKKLNQMAAIASKKRKF